MVPLMRIVSPVPADTGGPPVGPPDPGWAGPGWPYPGGAVPGWAPKTPGGSSSAGEPQPGSNAP